MLMLSKNDKYHLPHNSIRVDEFNFMLSCIDLNKEFYYYEDLRLLFLKKQISENKLFEYHPSYDDNLENHSKREIRQLYSRCKNDPSDDNLIELLNCQYTDKKTFKQVFNETVRDYTEFFAFLGLLTTYYKGRVGGEKKHFVTQRLKDYLGNKITLEELLIDFKYRNTSKDYNSLDMYSIEVRPFYVALKAIDYYFKKGFTYISKSIISAIVLYSKTENIDWLLRIFDNPELDISEYKNQFVSADYGSIKDELGRANLFLRPYLCEMKYVKATQKFYIKGSRDIVLSNYPKNVAFCNSIVGCLSITPVIGKVLYTLYSYSRMGFNKIYLSDLFDENTDTNDRDFILSELKNMKCILNYDSNKCELNTYEHQISINPYTEFFDIKDCDYVANIGEIRLYDGSFVANEEDVIFKQKIENIRQYALGSDGTAYENNLYLLLRDYFELFNVNWYGANSIGQRLSDITLMAKIQNEDRIQNIVIIIECKAGNAIKAYDERKEKADVINTLTKLKQNENQIDGVWYWVVNGDSLPSIDSHGGYRRNEYSKSFVEKLNEIQFSVSEMMRVPTIVTGFSFDSIKNYLCYLHSKTGGNDIINQIDVPHFWKWSRKFFNLQYVTVHKDLRLS